MEDILTVKEQQRIQYLLTSTCRKFRQLWRRSSELYHIPECPTQNGASFNAAQTIIHEMTHYYYEIGHCQHAEAICYAMEKMHILKRNYLTEKEWNEIVDLVVKNYSNLEWESGGYGDFEQFSFVRKDVK